MMGTPLLLEGLRLPGHREKPLYLDGQLLSIVDECAFDTIASDSSLTPAIGVATVLYKWCPEALLGLLDTANWFSFTWTLTLDKGTASESKIEIGRIRNQITMGELDREGLWKVMMTYIMSPFEDQVAGGPWVSDTEETMLDDKNVEDPAEVERLAIRFVTDLIARRRWLTGKKLRHEFFVESPHIGMDPWEDGMRMNPHWLYASLDLSRCTTCAAAAAPDAALNRCGRCGTASYCSSICQHRDWPVHKGVCTMSAEDRGKALYYTQYGGLVGWKQTLEAEE